MTKFVITGYIGSGENDKLLWSWWCKFNQNDIFVAMMAGEKTAATDIANISKEKQFPKSPDLFFH